MRPPLPPFTKETAIQKVRAAEDGWNGKNAEKVALAYSEDSVWRNRDTFLSGRPAIVEFLTNKWNTELEYRLVKELFAFTDNRIAVRYAYEYHTSSGDWYRAYGNENWEFNEQGLMTRRNASINDVAIAESERLLKWTESARPLDYASLSELGL
jgi:nuclear transport factor 2 (NTF2) superfamily protein